MNDVYITLRNSTFSGWLLHRIINHLDSCGLTYFIDREYKRRGDFPDTLRYEIENSQNFLIIATPDTWGRPDDETSWMAQEISIALKLNKNIITVISSDFIWPRFMPEAINEIRNKSIIVFDEDNHTTSLNIILASMQLDDSKNLSEIIAPYTGDEPFIFISYSHNDRDKVLPVLKRLIKDGYRIWYDDGINPGIDWAENIDNRIDECGYFISFVTQNYVNSENCGDEIQLARNLGKKSFLIYLEETQLTGALRLRASRFQNLHKYQYQNEQKFYDKLYQADGLSIFKNSGAARLLPPSSELCSDYIWYCCYGANIDANHFMKYIKRCSDRSQPIEEREFILPHSIYFGGTSQTWDGYGTAFLNYNEPGQSYGKIYKITEHQFQEIKAMEGSKYSKTINLGTFDGTSVYTFSCAEFPSRSVPNIEYLNTIIFGLSNLYKTLDDEALSAYFRNVVFSSIEYTVIKTIRISPHGLSAVQISQLTLLPIDDIVSAIQTLRKMRILKRDSRTPENADEVFFTVKKHRNLLDFLIV